MNLQYPLLMTLFTSAFLSLGLSVWARRLRVDVCLLLIPVGIMAGPEVLGWIQPWPKGLEWTVYLSPLVGLILFEVGLKLNLGNYRRLGAVNRGMLARGLLFAWLSTALFIGLFFDFSAIYSLLVSALLVTPTASAVMPLLQRLRVKKELHQALHHEALSVEAAGILLALVTFAAFGVFRGQEGGSLALLLELGRLLLGAVAWGGLAGSLLFWLMRRFPSRDARFDLLIRVLMLLFFFLGERWLGQVGLLGLFLAGLVAGYRKPTSYEQRNEYGVQLARFFLGAAVLWLVAGFQWHVLAGNGWKLGLVVLAFLAVRPLSLMLADRQASFSPGEKFFLSFMLPRGLTVALLAALFARVVDQTGGADGRILEALVYALMLASLLLQLFSTPLAGLFGVLEPVRSGWLLVGAHSVARKVARFLQDLGRDVVLLDTNPREVRLANSEGLAAYCENAMLMQENPVHTTGHLMAITENQDLNRLLCRRWSRLLPEAKLYRWSNDEPTEKKLDEGDAGQPIWEDWDLKAFLAELHKKGEKEQPKIRVAQASAQTFSAQQVLMCAREKQVSPFLGVRDKTLVQVLALEARQSTLIPIIRSRVIFCRDRELSQLFRRMLGRLKVEFPDLDIDALVKALLEREAEFTSMIGNGISLPHTYSASVTKPLVTVARVAPGIPCAHTGGELKLVFLLLSPPNQPVEHLNQISKIAKFVMNEGNRRALLDAESEEALYEAVHRF